MFDDLVNGVANLCGVAPKNEVKKELVTKVPFTFDDVNNPYKYPTLYEEADEMLQVALLIYTITDLRILAKKAKAGKLKKGREFKDPDKILTLPLDLGVCLELIEDNVELIKQEVGDADHEMTMSALQSIRNRYSRGAVPSSGGAEGDNKGHHWFNPFARGKVPADAAQIPVALALPVSPYLVAYGDDKPDSELVYAVGVDPVRKRVTVGFRGSVTPSDFLTDATISFQREPNPVKGLSSDQGEQIGIHKGFYDYLLKPRKEYGGESKCAEIFQHVTKLFADQERMASYKLYVTGHSLGGALATLFGFYAASSAVMEGTLPLPVSIVSIASPRVGDMHFQGAHTQLERNGTLRHLRVANEGDPVTMMPEVSGKKMWAMLSPISYAAFKMSDSNFEKNETYRHTGMKLLLAKRNNNADDNGGKYQGADEGFRISYSGMKSSNSTKEREIDSSEDERKSTSSSIKQLISSFKKEDLPDAVYHFGDTYCDNLTSVKDVLSSMTLNEMYKREVPVYAIAS